MRSMASSGEGLIARKLQWGIKSVSFVHCRSGSLELHPPLPTELHLLCGQIEAELFLSLTLFPCDTFIAANCGDR